MVMKERIWQGLGHGRLLGLLGLGMALGLALPADARPHRSFAAPEMAMGHGADAAEPDELSPAPHGAEEHDTNEPRAMGESEESVLTSPMATVPLIPASHGGQFSVGFPEGWVVSHGDTAPHLAARTPAGEPPLITEVSWQAEAPAQLVPALLNEIREKGYTMARYDAITVDGTTTLRLWLADLPESDLPYAFISVVGYSDATAILTSRYGTRSPDLDNLLSQIHQSFRRGTPSTAEPHHP